MATDDLQKTGYDEYVRMDEGEGRTEEGRQGLGLIPTTPGVQGVAGRRHSCQQITGDKVSLLELHRYSYSRCYGVFSLSITISLSFIVILHEQQTETIEDILPDSMSKSQTGFEENNGEEPVPSSGIKCHSKIMGQDLQGAGTENKATEVTQDKCPFILDRLCPASTTAVEENYYYSAFGRDLKTETDGDPAAVEVGTTASLPPTLSRLSKVVEENATHSPITLESQQSLSQGSSSRRAQCPSDAVSEERYGNVSHHTLPLTETKKDKMPLSLILPELEKQKKGKKGRPFKKKTIMKMAKLLAIAQEKIGRAHV